MKNSTKNRDYWKAYNERIKRMVETEPLPEGFDELEDALECLVQLIKKYRRYRDAFEEINNND